MEAATVSARDDLREGDDEARLRSWLQRQLTAGSRGRYKVPQEEEIDREKRPDLHIEHPGLPSLPIEIKWADRWSAAKLLERLENQLFGDYLHANDTRFGIFFIGYHGERAYWIDPATRKRLSLDGLRKRLQARADQLVAGRSDVESVRVVAVDFIRQD